MYDIKSLKGLELEFKDSCFSHFIEFFTNYDYEDIKGKVKKNIISSHSDINRILYGPGFYLILTDYMSQENECTLQVGELKVIYRGHGVRVRKRVESHLYNDKYNRDKGGTNYSVCMKLNDDNGININEAPYSGHSWAVIQHSMPNSSKVIREQAEQAFDEVFNQPVGSND